MISTASAKTMHSPDTTPMQLSPADTETLQDDLTVLLDSINNSMAGNLIILKKILNLEVEGLPSNFYEELDALKTEWTSFRKTLSKTEQDHCQRLHDKFVRLKTDVNDMQTDLHLQGVFHQKTTPEALRKIISTGCDALKTLITTPEQSSSKKIEI